MFEGSLLEHLSLITDEDICQAACQHVPACQYYIYDTNTKDCQLLDSSNRQCDLIRGSRNGPDYRKCMMHKQSDALCWKCSDQGEAEFSQRSIQEKHTVFKESQGKA